MTSMARYLSNIFRLRQSTNPTDTSVYRELTATKEDNRYCLDVALREPVTAFGEIKTAESTPLVQVDAVYGIRDDMETFSATGGSVSVKSDHNGKEFDCGTGTSVGGYGLIRSNRAGRYKAAEGMQARFTARFSTGIENCRLAAGLVTSGNELTFGYYTGTATNGTFDGTDFGILYRTGGRLEIQTLTISAAATGAETLTITLAGVAYSVTLSSGTAAHNAYEIAIDSDFGESQAWNAYQNGSTVVFIATTLGDKTGTFSVSSTGTFNGSFAETQAGTAAVDTFYTQSNWNIDTLTSTADSSFILDPTKGNVFEIAFQYLGYGRIVFKVEHPDEGKIYPVHSINYANNYTNPSLDNPSFKIGWFAASLGSTTDLHVYGGSGAMMLQGKRILTKRPLAHGNTKSISTTDLTSVIAFRVRPEINGYINLSEIFLREVGIAVENSGSNTAEFEVHINPTFSSGEPNWTYHGQTTSIIEYDTTAAVITSNTEFLGGGLAKSDSKIYPLVGDNVYLSRGDIVAIAVRPTGGTCTATAYLSWNED